MTAETVCLAFSGGLDTTWCVPHLRERHGAEVVTVTVDVGGFDQAERAELARRSKLAGAREHVHVDARELIFDEVLRPLIFGNVRRGHLYPLCVGAERSLQAREVARVAKELGATAIAHGCTAAGNDQVRFEIALRALAPEMTLLAPIRDEAPSREDEIADLERQGLPLPARGGTYSINSGLWGVTIGGGEMNGTDEGLPESAWVRTRGAFDAPLPPRELTIGFAAGVPVSLDGETLAPVALVETLDALAASFGIGRGIHLGDTLLGAKGRVAFEAPAATVLLEAHRELEKLTLSATQQRLKDQLAAVYGDLVHEGRGLESAARDIEAFFLSTQQRVGGDVRLLLRPGSVLTVGVSSPWSLHAASKSVYGEAALDWAPADAAGFSRIAAVPSVLEQRVRETS